MKLLDLFCGAGGAAVGYARAGFQVTGVDNEPQPNFPYQIEVCDALSLKIDYLQEFDVVHASPPCQRWSTATLGDKKRHPDLLRPIRKKLLEADVPYVIENVPGAPLYDPLILCGTLFPNLRVLRHRLFESSLDIPQPKLDCGNHPPIYKKDQGMNEFEDYVSIYGGLKSISFAAAKDAMGIDWMKRAELSQAIPPDYTHWIGEQILST